MLFWKTFAANGRDWLIDSNNLAGLAHYTWADYIAPPALTTLHHQLS